MEGKFQRRFFWKILLPALLLLVGTLWMGYGVEQHQFGRIIGGYGILFLVYFRILSDRELSFNWKTWLWIAAGLRLCLLFAFPGLSDDLYRFVWDGRLLAQGINPFDQLPAFYLEAGNEVPGLTADLFEQLNSPEYYTIYPPVAQTIFGLACWLFPNSLFGSMLIMRLFLLGCEWLCLWTLPLLLDRLNLPAQLSLLYALNPLVIIEVCGNLHFEGAMVAFFVVALFLLKSGKDHVAAAALALSVASKLLSLLFFPYFIRQLGWKRSIPLYLLSAGLLLLFFAPLLNGVFISHFGESLDLYFRRFEFNASVYYLLRWLGFQSQGYNMIAYIGPALALVAALGILLFAFLRPAGSWKSTIRYMLFGICLYLAMTTTVHPWYLCLPIALSLFTEFRFAIIWSALIPLTYINYSYPEYWENLWVVGIEYMLTGLIFGLEIYRYFKGNSNSFFPATNNAS